MKQNIDGERNRARRPILLSASAGILLGAALTAASCASADLAALKRQPEYWYGFGTAATEQAAAALARADLLRDARNGKAPKTRAEEATFALDGLKPYKVSKGKEAVGVAFRLPKAEWDRLERARLNRLRNEIGDRFDALRTGSGKPLADRVAEAGALLVRLSDLDLADSLAEREGGSLLFSRSVADYCRKTAEELRFALAPSEGFVHDQTSFRVAVTDARGAPVASLPLSLSWKAQDGTTVRLTAKTGADGAAETPFPREAAFRTEGTLVTLGAATAFSAAEPAAAVLGEIDGKTGAAVRFRHFSEVEPFSADEIPVAGGSFTAGALSHDRRAGKAEAPRAATVAAFRMDRFPVTNRLYRMYLEDAELPISEYPEYWEHPDYNAPDLPVVGVSHAQAGAFAAWLSSRLGYRKRLPTENEWEAAARGGLPVIYPWGDQSPTDGPRANYNRNRRFSGPSPVGGFEEGKNASGLYDMAGNVWEWTASDADAALGEGAAGKIVKGGSWMDGPLDLRVSNRKALDPSAGFADVGFRLVREVSNE